MKFTKSSFVLMVLAVLMCIVSAHGAKVRISPLTTDDGCISFTAGYPSWNSQFFNAGDENHWLGSYWPLAGIVKFVLPAEVTDGNVTVISATLHFYTWGDADGTNLGNKASDSNYPNGPFCQLQHFTTGRDAGINADDGTAPVENIAIDDSGSWSHVYYNVGTAVQNDKLAGNVRVSFLTRAVDYTGRVLSSSADRTAFAGYLTQYVSQDIAEEYATCRPYLEITYLHRPSPLATDDGCMSLTENYPAWDSQFLNAGDEDHWLGNYWPLMGIVKFILPAEVKQEDVVITEAKLHLYTMGDADGTSLGNKASDSNYPNGPFCQLQHFTTDRDTGINATDGTAPVENIAIDDSVSNRHVYYDVKTAVQNDITAENVRTSFLTRAVDYTGRILSGSADRTSFAGYLTQYASQEIVYADARPYLEISYIRLETVSPLITDDGCISFTTGYPSWNNQGLNAGDEDHWLGSYWPLGGIVKFVLPAQIADGTVTGATLRLYTWGGTDGTSLGTKASDSNYPNGPFCQLQHFTTDRAAGINVADGTAPVENIAIDDSTSWSSVSYDVRAAVQKDNDAYNVRTSFLTRAVDYTGRILSGSADKTNFAEYLTQYVPQDIVEDYAECRPYLDITYIPEATMPLTIVQSGVGMTAIVIPTTPKKVEEVAADELQYHIEQATGVILEVYEEVNEPTTFDGLIYLGACHATARAGINGSSLDDNGYIVRNVGHNFFLAGHDDNGEPLGMLHINYTQIGTMLAVYRFLEDYMDVKWLWPGVNGEVIPTTSNLVANGIDIVGKPVLEHTRLNDAVGEDWNWLNPCTTYTGWTNADVRADYLNEQSLWMRRQGFCKSTNLEYDHAFQTWWDTYQSSHPEYFNLLPDSTRRPDPYFWDGWDVLIGTCLSDSGFHQQIVANWVNNNGATGYINCAHNDSDVKCTCTNCMALDVQDPCLTIPWAERLTYATNDFNGEQSDWYENLGSMSDRLAKYLLAVQQKAADNDYLDATVFAFAYDNYAKGPISTQLNDRVVIGNVPGYYFPWTDAKRQAFRNSWNSWENSGVRQFLRPNYFLDGHNFPIYFADKFGSDFLYALKRGMFATIFDSLTGQWSTQGPNLYMLARVQTHHIVPDAGDPVAVSMGHVVGVNGDSLTTSHFFDWPQTLNGYDDDSAGNTYAFEMIVDMGQVQSVSAILIQNMPDNGYGLGEPGDIKVYVADDESTGLASSFTHEVTNGRTAMNVDNRGIANAWETFTLPSVINKRYVKIDITGNNQPSMTLYQWQDIAINTVPSFPFSAEAVAILDEFYKAFGPAESEVRAYFNHWKTVSDTTTVSPHYSSWYVKADEIFTPNVMATGRTLITNAQTAAVENPVAVRLVDILEKGFTNAEKTLAAQAAWEDYDNHGRVWQYWEAWKTAFHDLDNYRASVEDDFICNMGYLRAMENNNWDFTAPVPTFVAAGSITSGTGTITPSLPASITTGDILLLFIETSNQAVSISNQNGGTWTEVTNSPQGTGTAAGNTGARLTAFWSRYNGTQGAPTASDSGDHQMGRIIAIRGAVSTGNPWDVTAGGVEAASDTSGSIPGDTTTVGNTLVVTAIATSLPDSSSTTRFSSWTNANLASLTERTDNSETAGNGGGLGVATGIKATAGAYGNTAVTLAPSAYKGMMSIAIKP